MSKVYFEIFKSNEDILREFAIDSSKLDPYEIIIAYYEYANYSGSAFVLMKDKDGKLYEVNGSHCSCFGLENNQWKVEETTIPALKMRDWSWYLSEECLKELNNFLHSEPDKSEWFG